MLGRGRERERNREIEERERLGKLGQGQTYTETQRESYIEKRRKKKRNTFVSRGKRAEDGKKKKWDIIQGWRAGGPQARGSPSFWFLILKDGQCILQRILTPYSP